MSNIPKGVRTWLEIDKGALRANFTTMKELAGKARICAVAKSNAYGHGLSDYSFFMQDLGVDYIAVDSVVEGIRLRNDGITIPIIVLGYTLPDRFEDASKYSLEITVSNFESLEAVHDFQGELMLHIKVDTGMHRQGFLENDMEKTLQSIVRLNENIKIIGLYTHFAMAKNPSFPQFTKLQIASFEKWRQAFDKIGKKPICHASASSAALLYPEANYDMVRIGISLYGHWPAKEVEAFCKERINIRPALSWKAIVSEVKKVKAGDYVGYDCTEKLLRDSVLAVVPIGYWHGYNRLLSSIGKVGLNGKTARIVGRVSMDMIVIDVTDINGVHVGDIVELFGRGDTSAPTAEELAVFSDTSAYEFMTRLNPLMHKVYIE